MARVNRKSGSATRGRFKRKKMGKGYSTLRKEPIGTRPVLKITPSEKPDKVSANKTPAKEAKE